MKPRIIAYSNLYYEWIHPSTPYHEWKHEKFGGARLKTACVKIVDYYDSKTKRQVKIKAP